MQLALGRLDSVVSAIQQVPGSLALRQAEMPCAW